MRVDSPLVIGTFAARARLSPTAVRAHVRIGRRPPACVAEEPATARTTR
ncbi:hypothetical protein ACFXOM_27885 [Streptomyces sp. NPDC059169]